MMKRRSIADALRDLLAGNASAQEIADWGKQLTALADRAYRLASSGKTAAPKALAAQRELCAALAPILNGPPLVRDLLTLLNHFYRSDEIRLAAARRLLTALGMRPRPRRIAALLDAVLALHERGKREATPVAQRLGIGTELFRHRLRDEVRSKGSKDYACDWPLHNIDKAEPHHSNQTPDEVGPADLALLFTIATPRERELARHLLEGRTLAQAAKSMGVTQSVARQLLTRLRRRCG